jgi:hypothetical protein
VAGTGTSKYSLRHFISPILDWSKNLSQLEVHIGHIQYKAIRPSYSHIVPYHTVGTTGTGGIQYVLVVQYVQ